MKSTKEIVCCVVDKGLFLHVARRLARDYALVYYWSPWETGFPRLKDNLVGDGYPGLTRVRSVEDVVDECDLFVFPDIGFAALQQDLVKRGKAVWGARAGDELEEKRGKFLDVLAKTGLPVPKCERIHGLTALRKFLATAKDRFIKFSTYRGDFETMHWRSMADDESKLDAWAVLLGPLKEEFVFYVFEPIDAEIEDGIDTWCIDGQWPQTVIHGMEAKDCAYLGTFQKFAEVPKEVSQVNTAFSPVLKRYGYRSMFSTEVRITTKKESYFIDPTCRFPSPPSQVMMEMITNWGDIIWRGANGLLVEPVPAAKFGVQVIFKWLREEWGVFDIPPALDRWVKVSYSCKVGTRVCVPPDKHGIPEVGWVCAIGDTIEEAIQRVKDYAGQLPDGCKPELHGLPELLEKVATAEKMGMKFTSQRVPKPAQVL